MGKTHAELEREFQGFKNNCLANPGSVLYSLEPSLVFFIRWKNYSASKDQFTIHQMLPLAHNLANKKNIKTSLEEHILLLAICRIFELLQHYFTKLLIFKGSKDGSLSTPMLKAGNKFHYENLGYVRIFMICMTIRVNLLLCFNCQDAKKL